MDRLNKETTCNVMVDHLQSHVTPWRQYTSHVKVRGTLSKMDVQDLQDNHASFTFLGHEISRIELNLVDGKDDDTEENL